MSNQILTYSRTRAELLSRFPELLPRIEKTFGSYYDLKNEMPDAYPIFEDVVQEFLFELLQTGKDHSRLTSLFSFFEEMATSGDRDVNDLLGIAILEPLKSQPELSERARGYMGRKTMELGGWPLD
jgi:hypothetical protein